MIRLVLGRVAKLALLGGVIGAYAATNLGELMHSLLFGVTPADMPTLVSAAGMIGLTALLATLVPLARALRVDPAAALRTE